MLDSKTIKKIEDFVGQKPRSLFEVAKHIDVSWRTADRYVEYIIKEFGTIATRTFREGTRGALKIVYFASAEKFHSSVFQESLEKEILSFKKKEDFCAFDIYQHVDDSKKKTKIAKVQNESDVEREDLFTLFNSAQKQVLIFSGNLSFINSKNKKYDFIKAIESLIKKKISVKIVCRVDLVSLENIENVLSLNYKKGEELIEIRHAEQPIRAVVIDSKVISIKEIKEPTGKLNELNRKLFIYYIIKDEAWAQWLSRIFWKIFSKGIDANKRVEQLRKLKV